MAASCSPSSSRRTIAYGRIIPHSTISHPPPNCLIRKVTFESNVASKKMLPYGESQYTPEGANDESKKQILDEFVAATGYHRKYAIRMLRKGPLPKRLKKSGRRKVYQGEVIQALIQVWEICGRICSKRLHPFLPEMTAALERHNEIQLSPETKALLLRMSRSTIDRCLQPVRFERRRGLSTTKPGTLLKKAIPVRDLCRVG